MKIKLPISLFMKEEEYIFAPRKKKKRLKKQITATVNKALRLYMDKELEK